MARHDDAEARALQRKQTKDAKLDKTLRGLAVRDLLASDAGRAYIWWLLTITKYGVNPFAADSDRTSFNCGELNIGLQILAHLLEVDPAGFIRLQQEHSDARSRTDTDTDSELSGPDSDAGESTS